jgi:hypothetical protein
VATVTDPLAAKIAAIRERFDVLARPGVIDATEMPDLPDLAFVRIGDEGIRALIECARDVPCLLAALVAALEALARHQGVYAHAEGTVCAGCLEPVPCPDILRVTDALLGEVG